MKVSGTVTSKITSLESGDDRGVIYLNPLFLAREIDKPVPASKGWQRAKAHKNAVSFVVIVTMALLFIILPFLSVDSGCFGSSGFPKKTEKLVFLVYAGVLQHHIVLHCISDPTAKSTTSARQRQVLLLIAFMSWISFGPEEIRLPPSIKPMNTPKPGVGNCSVMQEVPEKFMDFTNPVQQENQKFMFYKYKEKKYSLFYRHPRIALDAVGQLFDVILSKEISNFQSLGPECQKLATSFFIELFFRPCGRHCQNSRYVCNVTCSLHCVKSTQFFEAFFENPVIKDTLSESTDLLFNEVGIYAMAVLKPNWPNSNEKEMEEWVKLSLDLIREKVLNLRELYTDGTLCKPISELKGEESCFTINGEGYVSPAAQKGVDDTANCNLTERNSHSVVDRTARVGNYITNCGAGERAFFWAVATTFFGNGMWLIVVWYKLQGRPKPSANQRGQGYRINFSQKAFMGGVGIVGYFFALAVIFSFEKVESLYKIQTPAVQLRFVYLILCAPFVMAATVATSVIATSVSGRGRIVKSKSEQGKNPFLRILTLYQKNTSPRYGPWFLTKVMFWESLEICIQFSTLHVFAHGKPQSYVIAMSSILCLNILVTALVFYRKFYSSKSSMWNNAEILAADTLLDTFYFAINTYYMEGVDLYSEERPFTASIVGAFSVSWPVICVLLRIRSITRLIILKPDSTFKLKLKIFRGAGSSHTKRKTAQVKKKGKVCLILLGIATVFFTSQFLFLVVSTVEVNARCSRELGKALWYGASPKYTFVTGLYDRQDCNYEKITKIIASGKKIKFISPYIGKCKNLKTLELEENYITHLPRELILMPNIEIVKLHGNPVSTALNASGMSLGTVDGKYGIPSFIHKHLGATLKTIDLSNNKIRKLGERISGFTTLETLILSNNNVEPNQMSWKIVKLFNKLQVFVFDNNPISTNIDWADQPGFHNDNSEILNNCIKFLKKFALPSIKVLNLSNNDFTNEMVKKLFSNRTSTLETLDLSLNEKIYTIGGNPFSLNLQKQLPQLRHLNVTGCKNI